MDIHPLLHPSVVVCQLRSGRYRIVTTEPVRQVRAVGAMSRVHAASLRASEAGFRESDQTKQEPARPTRPTGSTAPAVAADRRAADAKSGTGPGQ
jgi:hypothetical protein